MTSAPPDLDALIEQALAEDGAARDVTTRAVVPPEARADAEVVARARGVVAGLAVAKAVFRRLDPEIAFAASVADGDAVAPETRVLALRGRAHAVLAGERVALNFLQRLSGVATLTRRYVDAVAGTGVAILDTRKTTPGLRALERAAVRAGGGRNHRDGLADMVLVKENHVRAAGSIAAAVARARASAPGMVLEVEARTVAEAVEAAGAGVDRLLFDNFAPGALSGAVRAVREAARGRGARCPTLEASGGVTLDTVRAIAETGVDEISVGALTHSAPALDLSLLVRDIA